MPLNSIAPLTALPRLERMAPQEAAQALGDAQPAASGFATMLNDMISRNHQANAAADAAVQDLATGKAQDLHTVSLAVSQADVSFRMILELRNRLADAFQEITRMQV